MRHEEHEQVFHASWLQSLWYNANELSCRAVWCLWHEKDQFCRLRQGRLGGQWVRCDHCQGSAFLSYPFLYFPKHKMRILYNRTCRDVLVWNGTKLARDKVYPTHKRRRPVRLYHERTIGIFNWGGKIRWRNGWRQFWTLKKAAHWTWSFTTIKTWVQLVIMACTSHSSHTRSILLALHRLGCPISNFWNLENLPKRIHEQNWTP